MGKYPLYYIPFTPIYPFKGVNTYEKTKNTTYWQFRPSKRI